MDDGARRRLPSAGVFEGAGAFEGARAIRARSEAVRELRGRIHWD